MSAWHPAFGEEVENTYASPSNPVRRGRFVRAGLATGRMSPGPWWELTDGHGQFWRCNPENCRPPRDDGYCGQLGGACREGVHPDQCDHSSSGGRCDVCGAAQSS